MIMKVISIKQPWAWLVCGGYKRIENRTWRTKYRGPALIHTGKKYDIGSAMWLKKNMPSEYCRLPLHFSMETGGIVGCCDIVDVVTESDDPWFFGPYGFVLENASRVKFIPTPGRLGIFNVDLELHQLRFRCK